MKKYNVGEIVLIIMAGTVGLTLCMSVLGMIIHPTEANQFSEAIREKLIDLVETIAGAVIGVVATMISQNKDKPQ